MALLGQVKAISLSGHIICEAEQMHCWEWDQTLLKQNMAEQVMSQYCSMRWCRLWFWAKHGAIQALQGMTSAWCGWVWDLCRVLGQKDHWGDLQQT